MSFNPYNDDFPNKMGSPIFFHKPHGGPSNGIIEQTQIDFEALKKKILANANCYKFHSPANVLFLTYSNLNHTTPIENCYKTYNIPHVVLGRNEKKWNWTVKIRAVLEYLQNHSVCQDYVLATDANDVILINDPELVTDIFEFYECDILFCNTNTDWPPNKVYRDFESHAYYTHQFHSHLSAGGYIARKEALINYLLEISSGIDTNKTEFLFNGKFDDQLAWRFFHFRDHPRIKVDFRSLIFKRFDLFRNLDQDFVTIME